MHAFQLERFNSTGQKISRFISFFLSLRKNMFCRLKQRIFLGTNCSPFCIVQLKSVLMNLLCVLIFLNRAHDFTDEGPVSKLLSLLVCALGRTTGTSAVLKHILLFSVVLPV